MAAIEAVGGAIAAAGIAEKVQAITDAYKECVQVAGDFEQAMSAVEAIANSNASEMAALTAEAKELGATTKFTAQQSANAMEYMAMAGWNAQEMLGGMNGVINLAAAAGEDLAQVSDIVTDNLSAFGLKASDTAHFADVLAAAAANSNTNISIMGETFKSSSSVAGALGYSIEDVAVMVGLMANNAVKGSRAGTALRNIFNGLLGGVTLTSEAFGELDYSAVNIDGSMKGLMETVEDLRGYFSQMTEAERVNNAQNIAGMRGYNGLLAILNATDEDFQSLYNSVTNCTGAAERMAKVKLDNLNGDITIANSAMEALQSTIGEQFNPKLRELTQLKTELLNGLNAFIKENPGLVKGVAVGVGAFLKLGTAIVGVNAAIKTFKALKLATLFTGPAGVLLGVATGLSAIAAAAVGAREAYEETVPAAMALNDATEELNRTLSETSVASIESDTLVNATAAENYLQKIEELGAVQNRTAEQEIRYQSALAGLLQVAPQLSDSISQTTDEYGRVTYAVNGSTDAIKANIEVMKQQALMAGYQNSLTEIENQIATAQIAEQNAKSALVAVQDEQAAMVDEQGRSLVERRKSLMKALEDPMLASEDPLRFESLTIALGDVNSQLSDTDRRILEHKNSLQEAKDTIGQATELEDNLFAAMEANGLQMGATAEKTREFDAGMQGAEDSSEAVLEALKGVTDEAKELAEAYSEAKEAAAESVESQYGLWDKAKEIIPANVQNVIEAVQSQIAYWNQSQENLEFLSGYASEINGLGDALAYLASSASQENIDLLAGLTAAAKNGDTETLQNFAAGYTDLKTAQDEYATLMAEQKIPLKEAMQELVDSASAAIEEMDLGAEAWDAAMNTINGYLAVMKDPAVLAEVQSAYGNLYGSLSGSLMEANKKSGMTPTAIMRYERGFATGTENAPPGWAWVGEEGPELMRMRGGEQILPNSVSQEAAQIYNIYNRYSAEYQAAQAIQSAQSGAGPDFDIPGYASGTGSAPQGPAWMGEGPELLRMYSGEQIPPNSVLQEVAQIYNIYNRYSAEYQAAQAIQSAQSGTEPDFDIPGYASGTGSAPQGSAWMGEEGPELMRMYGGEQILPNSVSQEVAQIYNTYNRYSAEYQAAQAIQSAQSGAGPDLPDYAGGSSSAPQGPGWMGEGPELLRMYGGEQILPNSVSQEVAQIYNTYNRYSAEYQAARASQSVQDNAGPTLEIVQSTAANGGPVIMELHFHIEAGASPETVDAWQDYARRGELKATILEVMEDARADARRRTME